jgi:predicted lipoprotein
MSNLSFVSTAGRCGAVVALALLGSACRIEHRVDAAATAGGQPVQPGGQFQNQSFDAQAQVVDLWESRVVPALAGKAADFVQLRADMKADPDKAGAAHGHRDRGEGAPWNMATRLTGRVVVVETESSAGKIALDVDADGQADVVVQIGPVLRGTAIRDSLPFVSFTAYANQVEFAQLANAFNDQAYRMALKALPRDALMGQTVELLGAFTADDAADLPTITPVQLRLGAK